MDDERDNCGDFPMLKNTTPEPCPAGRGKSRFEGVSLKADVTLPKLTRVPVPMKRCDALFFFQRRAGPGTAQSRTCACRPASPLTRYSYYLYCCCPGAELHMLCNYAHHWLRGGMRERTEWSIQERVSQRGIHVLPQCEAGALQRRAHEPDWHARPG